MNEIKGTLANVDWNEIDVAGSVQGGGTSLDVNTGNWRVKIPTFIEEKCNHCMLCFPVCPDYAIPVKNDKRGDFDFEHCKGCGVCFKACLRGAITWEKEDK